MRRIRRADQTSVWRRGSSFGYDARPECIFEARTGYPIPLVSNGIGYRGPDSPMSVEIHEIRYQACEKKVWF